MPLADSTKLEFSDDDDCDAAIEACRILMYELKIHTHAGSMLLVCVMMCQHCRVTKSNAFSVRLRCLWRR